MKNQWRVFIGLFLVLIIVIFAVLNNQEVPVSFGFAKITGPLILIILGSAIIGTIVGLIASTSKMWQQHKEIKKLEKDTEEYKKNASKMATEEADKVRRECEVQLAELQAKYDAVIQTMTIEPELSDSRVDRFTNSKDNEKH